MIQKYIRPHLHIVNPVGRGRSGSTRMWKYAELPGQAFWYYMEVVLSDEKSATRRGFVFCTFDDVLLYLKRNHCVPEFVLMYVPRGKRGLLGGTFVELEAAYSLPNEQGFMYVSTERQVLAESEVTVLEKHGTNLTRVFPPE